jgi:hypothetical protein
VPDEEHLRAMFKDFEVAQKLWTRF